MEEQNIQVKKPVNKFDLHKVFAAIGVILIVMVIFGGVIWYFVQSAEDKAGTIEETTITKVATTSAKIATPSAKINISNWKTYTNSEVKFTIKYPSDWKISESSTDNLCTTDQAFFAPTSDLLGKCASGFGGLVGIFRTEVGLDINKQAATYTNTDYKNLVKTNTTLAGKNAIKVTGISQISNEALNQKDYTVIFYVVDLGNKRSLLLSYTQSPNSADNSAIFETMVTTLKFN